MGATAKWQLWLNCWKEHTCVLCGGAFRYRLRRCVVAHGMDNAEAEKNAWEKLEPEFQRHADGRPCPHCGCIQPQMLYPWRTWVHVGVPLATLTAVGGIAYLIFELNLPLLGLSVGLALGLLAWLISAGLVFWGRNRSLDINLRRAEKFIELGELDADVPGGERKPVDSLLVHSTDRKQKRMLAWCLPLTLLLAVPLLVPVICGWPFSRGIWPPFVGPGDTVVVPIEVLRRTEIPNGKWFGSVLARVVEADDPALIGTFLPAKCIGGRSKAEEVEPHHASRTPSAEVHLTLPNKASLAGQRLVIDLELNLVWANPPGSIPTRQRIPAVQSVEMRLAPPGLVSWYSWLFYAGVAGGLLSQILLLCVAVRLGAADVTTRRMQPARLRRLSKTTPEDSGKTQAPTSNAITKGLQHRG